MTRHQRSESRASVHVSLDVSELEAGRELYGGGLA
jgi:hypothetical protein